MDYKRDSIINAPTICEHPIYSRQICEKCETIKKFFVPKVRNDKYSMRFGWKKEWVGLNTWPYEKEQ